MIDRHSFQHVETGAGFEQDVYGYDVGMEARYFGNRIRRRLSMADHRRARRFDELDQQISDDRRVLNQIYAGTKLALLAFHGQSWKKTLGRVLLKAARG